MFDPNGELTQEQVDLCNKAGVTIPEVRAEWTLFLDAELDVVIGNVLSHREHIAEGVEDAPVPEEDQSSPSSNEAQSSTDTSAQTAMCETPAEPSLAQQPPVSHRNVEVSTPSAQSDTPLLDDQAVPSPTPSKLPGETSATE